MSLTVAGDYPLVSDITLTAAQVKALFSSPITIVPAPAAGVINVVDCILFGSTFVSAAYAGANALEFRYTNASGAKVTADIASGTLNFSSGTKYAVVHGVTTELAAVAAAAIVVCVPVANPTTGDSLVRFRVHYHEVSLP
jgi:hypothetical protein